ncbi:mRNA export factor mexA [Aspergillus saccharolyticus JOP 1030-1]|uniref:mRNA export factor MEX67 n=1 Tax=Aspergillus saccharolyticus JOP 1030-1 TaxID=1450539 RepID=A0A318ZSG3_9EURO|nr:NTF2-like protein [Aspergillus saccharolyticus JOP 1030-1]PYH50067.1 NTF2-like protein [Aspergillus saccharolyticus JOP 1030-1]
MRNAKAKGRTSASDRGGIRKRGAAKKVDREGDLVMDGNTSQSRAKKGRGDSGRSGASSGTRSQTSGRALDAIQKAISSNSDSPQANIRQGSRASNLEQVSVRGWKDQKCKARSNPDGGQESLISFLEKKLSVPAGTRARITKSRVEGDALVVSIKPELLDRMLKISGFSFAGAPLTIEKYDQAESAMLDQLPVNGSTPSAADTKAKMTAFLAKRFNRENKLLDLSDLHNDPDLIAMGIFQSTSTESKFFPALMKVWELNLSLVFDSPAARRQAVESVSLRNNKLANLKTVTTLAQTFPDLKNLDLSMNDFKDAQSLLAWRHKFENLELLDLSNTPFSADPTFKDTMLKWYLKLRILNGIEVRTAEELAALKKSPIPVQAPYFRDEGCIAENFIRAFFSSYDNDRNGLLDSVYDSESTFTLNINTAAPRAHQADVAAWDAYIKNSRNLLRITHLTARMSRTHTGTEKIRKLWNGLPATRHPDIAAHPQDWLIECYPIPGLLDPTGQSPTGVGGLLITVHGRYDEIGKGSKIDTRSFDRTFVLGPGGGAGGVRVINDILCCRAYGGNEAWLPEVDGAGQEAAQQTTTSQPTSQVATPQQVAGPPATPEGYGMPAPGKSETQLQQERLVLQVMSQTGMTLQYSELAISGNGWDLEKALQDFVKLKGTLPPEAFLAASA